MAFLLRPWSSSTTSVATATAVIAVALWPRAKRDRRVIANPLKTSFPKLSEEQRADLVYLPDQFPGARDVDTPYGSIRVYEFGPEDGRKVLFIHGISTPCVTLTHLAHGLVERGCRVMLFDLFGRGFSDGVGDLPHDPRLYVSQSLLAMSSSELAWTGSSSNLLVVGYSLGAGIAVHLANTIPHVVESLALVAPAGLIREESFGAATRFLFKSGYVPDSILAPLAKTRLQRPIAASRRQEAATALAPTTIGTAEAADPAPGENVTRLERRVLAYVRWMAQYHDGFIPAFLSSIRFSPLIGQHESYARISERKPGKTAIVLAENDEIITLSHFSEDAPPLFGGKDSVFWNVLPGGHDFVMTHPDEVLAVLDTFLAGANS